MISRVAQQYGMLGVLLLVALYFSYATTSRQSPTGSDAGKSVAAALNADDSNLRVVIARKSSPQDEAFADALVAALADRHTIVGSARGTPRDVRQQLEAIDRPIDVIAAPADVADWVLLRDVAAEIPVLGKPRIAVAAPALGSAFLNPSNLRNILNQIVVIAITAVGMTFVIITAGIDLSVGSLIALSAVVTTALIRNFGGTEATGLAMVLCSVVAVLMCGTVGLFSGMMITRFRVPPFIATLAVMQIASGLAFILAQGKSIYQVPQSFTTLGIGTTFWIPNGVILMALVFMIGHIVMSKMVVGRYIYAVGGNPEAARLSGVPVNRVLLLVYVISGITAGIGGVVQASQLKSGAPTYGLMYELYAIAAVVVGGTSLAGGEGKIIGTLIGALIIAVIQNGMNLTGVESYTQKVVLGAVILGAVLLDMIRRHGWRMILRPAN